MGIPVLRLPLLVQIVLFGLMKLPEKIMLSSLSKQSRRISKVVFKCLPFKVQIHNNTHYTICLNGEEYELDLEKFRAGQYSKTITCRMLKGIFRGNDSFEAMTLKLVEFLFEVLTNLTISVSGNEINSTANLLDVIRSCKDKYENEKAVVKLVFNGDLPENATLPLLHSDEVIFESVVDVNQLIEMVMTCRKVVVQFNNKYSSNNDDLKKIIESWMSGSRIEYLELFLTRQTLSEAMQGVTRRGVRFEGQNRFGYVIRQASGKEALVYYNAYFERRIYLRTDFLVAPPV